jgi:xylulokinase
MDCGGYMLNRTTGRQVCEWGNASVTGLFSLKSKTWETTLIRLFGLDPAKFPELVRSIDQVGGLKAAPASELGLLAGTPVFGGGGDALCTAVGSGAVAEGEAHLTVGTSGYIAVLTSQHISGRHGTFTMQSADPSKLMLIAESETVGACLKWAARELYGMEPGDEAYSRMDAEVAASVAGSEKLIFTPWMYGERCPVPDESVRAAFINLGANHTRRQMTRAVYEGVAYNFRWILDLIKGRYGFPCQTLRVVGGGARGLPWLRILADVTGRQLEKTPHDQDAAAVGAALIASIGSGIHATFESVKPLVPATESFRPDPDTLAIYEPTYRAYRKIYPAIKGLYHELNRAG